MFHIFGSFIGLNMKHVNRTTLAIFLTVVLLLVNILYLLGNSSVIAQRSPHQRDR